MSKFYNPKIQKVSVIVENKPNQLYAKGMGSFEQYDQICKYFAKGNQRDANANEVRKQLKLHDLNVREYYALWLDFKHHLQIEKKDESAGALNAYIYLIINAHQC